MECEMVRNREGCQSFIDFLIFVKIRHILIFEGDYDYLPYRCDESQVLAKSSVQFRTFASPGGPRSRTIQAGLKYTDICTNVFYF